LGFGGLKPEKSTNFSLGAVFNPVPNFTITLDAYQITIRDRIMTSTAFSGFTGNRCPADYDGSNAEACLPFDADLYAIYNQPAVYNAVQAALGGAIPGYVILADNGIDRNTEGGISVQSFVNGVKMRTRGIDLVANYSKQLGDLGKLDLTFTGNYNANKVLGINALPSALYSSTANPALTRLIDASSEVELEHSTPRFRGTFNAFWQMDKLSVNLRESYYSQVYTLDTARLAGPDFDAGDLIKTPVKAGFITDLEVGYQIAAPIKVSIGANNLFNKYPTERSMKYIRSAELANRERGYSTSKYPTISPFGINGGYYYARVNVTF
jgi:iron complex outermembrane receptor protein